MGAGKSTAGFLLAPLLGWRFLDVDAVIVERAGETIAALFARYGEPWFRELEAVTAAELLRERNAVIAFGGGAVEHEGTQAKLAGDTATLVVHLQTSLAVSLARCREEPGAASRPVLAEEAALEQRYAQRLPLYRAAHLTVETAARTPLEVARVIADAVQAPRRAEAL